MPHFAYHLVSNLFFLFIQQNRSLAKTPAEKLEYNQKLERAEKQIQMSILAVSEALGFAG